MCLYGLKISASFYTADPLVALFLAALTMKIVIVLYLMQKQKGLWYDTAFHKAWETQMNILGMKPESFVVVY